MTKRSEKKKVNPHALRHVRATVLTKFITEPQIRIFLGLSNDSEMTSIHAPMSGRDIDYAILKIYGDKHLYNSEAIKNINPFAKDLIQAKRHAHIIAS